MSDEKRTILVVDDEESNVDMLGRRLQRAGYGVLRAFDGDSAKQILAETRVDLVLLDQMMPGQSGTEVLRDLRTDPELFDVPVIMVTAVSEGEAVAAALDLGADDYVTKPVEFQSALARIRSHISKSTSSRRLRLREERYSLASRGGKEGLWDWNLETDEVYCTSEFYSVLGFSQPEKSERSESWLERIHPADVSALRAAILFDDHALSKDIGAATGCGFENGNIHVQVRMLHRDGIYRRVALRGVTVFNPAGQAIRRVGSLSDVNNETTLEGSTGLYTSLGLQDAMEAIHHDGHRQHWHFWMLEFANYESVVRGLGGHDIEDLWRELLSRIKRVCSGVGNSSCSNRGMIVARLGENGCGILWDPCDDASSVQFAAKKLHEELGRPFTLADRTFRLNAMLGVVPGAAGYQRVEDLIADAKSAMQYADRSGGLPAMFDRKVNETVLRMRRLEIDLANAMQRGEIMVYYQPRVDMRNRAILGFEALVRWMHGELGMISPAEFIPIAEKTGLIHELGLFVLDSACRQTKLWVETLSLPEDFEISVNLSAVQCREPGLVDRVQRILQDIGIAPGRVNLELTESTLLENLDHGKVVLNALKGLGVGLKIDDFGTGFSSLQYLCELPFDALKIDRSFVRKLSLNDADAVGVVQGIIDLARKLGLGVVAEGVEECAQSEKLLSMGCESAQGFMYSKPVDRSLATDILRTACRVN